MEIDWRKHIHSDPGILGGKPVIRGTRVPVDLVLDYLVQGGSVADVVDGYPSLTDADVRAAVAFSNHLMTKEAAAARRLAA